VIRVSNTHTDIHKLQSSYPLSLTNPTVASADVLEQAAAPCELLSPGEGEEAPLRVRLICMSEKGANTRALTIQEMCERACMHLRLPKDGKMTTSTTALPGPPARPRTLRWGGPLLGLREPPCKKGEKSSVLFGLACGKGQENFPLLLFHFLALAGWLAGWLWLAALRSRCWLLAGPFFPGGNETSLGCHHTALTHTTVAVAGLGSRDLHLHLYHILCSNRHNKCETKWKPRLLIALLNDSLCTITTRAS